MQQIEMLTTTNNEIKGRIASILERITDLKGWVFDSNDGEYMTFEFGNFLLNGRLILVNRGDITDIQDVTEEERSEYISLLYSYFDTQTVFVPNR